MYAHGEIPEFRQRYRFLVAIVVVTFAVLLGRLWQLQIVDGDEYRRLAQDNFIQERRIPTVRGIISDRKRRLLVTNRPSYDVYIAPRFAKEKSIDRLINELSLPPIQIAKLRKRLASVPKSKLSVPLLVIKDISRDELARLEMHKEFLEGVSVEAVVHRNYIHGNLAAHVLGYLNEISSKELAQDKDNYYQFGDFLGRFGIERMYETHLRGTAGWERVVVDSRGLKQTGEWAQSLLGSQKRQEPHAGHNLILTIDLDLQRWVERAMRRYPSGAAVVMEVNTGRILASVSRPAFDPNILTGRLSEKEAKTLLDDPHRPLLDKVFRENYYPGSIYKVISAIAAVEGGAMSWDEKMVCKGWHHFGRRNFKCSHAHKKVDLKKAIIQSCNVFFYSLAERVGMDAIANYGREFGLGASTGLGLNGEVAGFIPTKEWYSQIKKPFRIGYTLNSAIGQGNTKTTPIQIVNVYAAIANGGTLYLPQIVERIETVDGQVVQPFATRIRRRVNVKAETLSRVREALYGVVQDKDGTAYESRIEDIAISGKTGTAQVSRRQQQKTLWLQDHSWFAAFAPSEQPVIAVAVLIEHGGRAAKVAAPVAMEIIRGYFKYLRSDKTSDPDGEDVK